MNKNRNLLFLILSVILIFIIGVMYEADYRTLTRNSIKYFADYKLSFYGAKEFRIFETDIAFILTLIPISFFVLTKNLASFVLKVRFAIFYGICIPAFYCLYCFLESEFIKITITLPDYVNGALMYHSNNINYRLILFATIISTYIVGIISKKIIIKANR